MRSNSLLVNTRASKLLDQRWKDRLDLCRNFELLICKYVFAWIPNCRKITEEEFHAFQNREFEILVDLLNWQFRCEESLGHVAPSDQACDIVELVLAVFGIEIYLTQIFSNVKWVAIHVWKRIQFPLFPLFCISHRRFISELEKLLTVN